MYMIYGDDSGIILGFMWRLSINLGDDMGMYLNVQQAMEVTMKVIVKSSINGSYKQQLC